MISNVGLISYLTTSLAFGILALSLAFTWQKQPYRVSLCAACSFTSIWALVIAGGTLQEYPPIALMQLAEVARNASWIYFLLQMTAMRFDGSETTISGKRWRPLFIIAVCTLLAVLFLVPLLLANTPAQFALHQNIILSSWLGMAIIGLLLLEQIFRNANDAERWSLKYLCFGMGGFFSYDLLMYSEGLLFGQLDAQYWQARGIANALTSPLLAISFARSSSWKMALNISRQVVFHTVSLLGAGIYLITMAVVGYFIKFMGGSWGGVLQISFLIAAATLLLALLFSGKIRANTRVFLSKHFFSYKYDYREQWLKFTHALAGIEDHVPEGIINAMSSLVSSNAGLLWGSNDGKNFLLLAHWQMPAPDRKTDLGDLPEWLEQCQWVIDIDEHRNNPDIYNNLSLPLWVREIPDAWLIIPLMFGSKLHGILLLRHSQLQHALNWEDRDLLKTAGRQSASHLAQYLASSALVEARQFDAFNRLSAYVVHDLKNILAQQSLMISNAEKHKHNTEFVDDMIATVSNSVERMTKLMKQMRTGMREAELQRVDLNAIIQNAVNARNVDEPQVNLNVEVNGIYIECDHDQLCTVFGHLIKNGQEACEKHGRVGIRVLCEGEMAVIEIHDNGKGMDTHFIESRLFKPFESTKGLTGMGIGAFESREFIRSLGGDIIVQSEPGKGSLFRLYIPCLRKPESG